MKKIVITSIAALAVSTSLMAAVNSGACVGCHGGDFSKKAMNKSMVVSEMTHAEIEAALLAYKAGTRNNAGMGGLMKGQVAKYSEADLKAFAQTIGK